MHQNPLLVILGPTASGKTKLAVRLAESLNGEVISADSRQVFKGMDIGTGKDLNEYLINGRAIPYHLIDHKLAGERYNVNEFKEDFYKVYKALTDKHVLPILCGGTGMYVHSILQNHEYTAIPANHQLRDILKELDIELLRAKLSNYTSEFTKHADQSSHKRMIRAIEIAEYLTHNDLQVIERPKIDPLVIGLTSDVELRRQKVIDRLELRFDEGMIDEVKRLLDEGVTKDDLVFYGLEYKFVAAYLFDELTYSELKERLAIAICQFAKRQMTFFRKMEKDGVKINWFNTELDSDEIFEEVVAVYKSKY
ncbi:tRNA (adenosine(37)-N6)-dimethylallyltransferase MiaA [Pedobacter foliorum]|uniref:tRNA (adenosine(37)-N6)-dimethylallyltransferase MiaA n=1 Tax=Pedobacter foliorum TaxID=2739058 RepID=UPI00156694BB|nr:tRNA (adenosine(37)-N6)-dimethylallyltransferase MiaA [Pedobacter foliorum]NRF38238.1 tRNA (adenosine(37)-N6)-dimethylallyltransferase MiaA [Pedobacter foliorum]